MATKKIPGLKYISVPLHFIQLLTCANSASRIVAIVFVLLLASCAPQQNSASVAVDPYRQATLDDAKSLIGKKIWVLDFGDNLCNSPSSLACKSSFSNKWVGPLYVKDVLLPSNDYGGFELYLAVGTADGSTKYWRTLSSNPSHDVLFEDPKVTAAHSKATCDRKGGVSIGMTEAKVLASCWGKPQKKNVTEGVGGSHEQWVYDSDNYLYFDSGILTNVQTTR